MLDDQTLHISATTMDTSILAASAYNCIRRFEDQVQTIPYEHLRKIGNIYISCDVHKTYGIGILHRHFTLDPGCIMVHEAHDEHVDVCRPRQLASLPNCAAYPDSFLLNDQSEFQSYEYSSTWAGSILSEGFLYLLRNYLLQHGLRDVIAIIPKPDTGTGSSEVVETIVPALQAMKTSPARYHHNIAAHDLTFATTGWMFDKHEDGGLEIREVKKCESLPTGLHKVTDDRTRL